MSVEKPKAILLKILGVTTSWKFAKQELINYVSPNIKDYLDRHWNDQSLQGIVNGLKNNSQQERANGLKCPEVKGNTDEQMKHSVIEYVKWSMKHVPLKAATPVNDLQGYIWGEGFKKGSLKAHLYPDVDKAIKEWKANEIKVYTFSTGSVEGQQTYFANSIYGDLSRLIDGHISARSANLDKFDTGCYAKMTSIVMEDRENILFLTNSTAEAKAALLAGLKVMIVIREGNTESIDLDDLKHFPNIKDFNEIRFYEGRAF